MYRIINSLILFSIGILLVTNSNANTGSNRLLYLKFGNVNNWTKSNVSGSQSIEIDYWKKSGYQVTPISLDDVKITPALLKDYDVVRLYSSKNRSYSKDESESIYNFVISGGKLFAEVPHTSDVSVVKKFGVVSITGENGGDSGLRWSFNGAPLIIKNISGPLKGKFSLAVECMDRPSVSKGKLEIGGYLKESPVVSYGDFGRGRVVLIFAANWSHDKTYPGNAYRSSIKLGDNLDFLKESIKYLSKSEINNITKDRKNINNANYGDEYIIPIAKIDIRDPNEVGAQGIVTATRIIGVFSLIDAYLINDLVNEVTQILAQSLIEEVVIQTIQTTSLPTSKPRYLITAIKYNGDGNEVNEKDVLFLIEPKKEGLFPAYIDVGTPYRIQILPYSKSTAQEISHKTIEGEIIAETKVPQPHNFLPIPNASYKMATLLKNEIIQEFTTVGVITRYLEHDNQLYMLMEQYTPDISSGFYNILDFVAIKVNSKLPKPKLGSVIKVEGKTSKLPTKIQLNEWWRTGGWANHVVIPYSIEILNGIETNKPIINQPLLYNIPVAGPGGETVILNFPVEMETEEKIESGQPIIDDLINLAGIAQQYYRKPSALGGGGNSFEGWTIPTILQSTKNGIYEVESIKKQLIIITGTNKQNNDKMTNRKISILVSPNDYKLNQSDNKTGKYSDELKENTFDPYKDFLSNSPQGTTTANFTVTKDFIISDLTNLASMAQQFYRKPMALDGGGNSFTRWDIPENLKFTENGNYFIENINSQSVFIIGEKGDKINSVKVRMKVYPNEIEAQVIN